MSRSIKEINNVLDGSISLMIGDFEFAMGSMGGVWLVVKAAVSKWTAQAQQLTKKLHEQFHGNLILTGLDNDVNRKKIKRGPGKQGMKGKHFLLAKEIKYIQDRAAEHDGRFVT